LTLTSQSYVLDPDTLEWVFEDGRRIPVFAGGDDGAAPPASDYTEGQPEGDDDPGQEQDGKTPAQPGKKEKGAAPWAKDLDAMRDHEDPFEAFNEYLATKWQPRTTQLEQSVAEFSKMFGDVDTARMVADFMSTLDGNPKETLRQLAQSYGVDPMDLLEVLEDEANPDPSPEEDKTSFFDDEDRKWVQQQREQETQAKQDQALQNLLQGFEDEIPGFDRDLYVYMLKASDYDAEEALETYMKWHREPEAKDDPPPTGGGQKGATPREAPQYKSIGDAMKAFLRDEAAKA
jgi:hypothetical protein